jgi:hypothetical protein
VWFGAPMAVGASPICPNAALKLLKALNEGSLAAILARMSRMLG